ncbi:MAG: hypothetical protein J2P27_08885, partial [Actinobacteria bacterium]|nr:hypothetical protein [Actinomycetota bacterium]
MGEWAARLDERSRTVFERRIARADRTLADIAGQYSLSSERIRQLQRRITRELSACLREPPALVQVAELRARLKAACAVLRPWAELTAVVPELAHRIPGTEADLADLAGFLLPDLCRYGDWAGWQPVAQMRARTVQIATRSVPVGFRGPRLAALQRDLAMNAGQWDAWLGFCGLRPFRGSAVRMQATVPELAEAVLAAVGRPMTSAQIAAAIAVPTWKVRDACLGKDSRFRRTRPATYGLAEWPMPAYKSIRTHIIEEIAAAGGQARLDDVTTSLARRFGVSPNSVFRYAQGREFSLPGGVIRL